MMKRGILGLYIQISVVFIWDPNTRGRILAIYRNHRKLIRFQRIKVSRGDFVCFEGLILLKVKVENAKPPLKVESFERDEVLGIR